MCDGHAPAMTRRRLIQAGAASLAGLRCVGAAVPGALALAAPLSTGAWADAASPAVPVAPDVALERLVQGNARYAANAPANKDFSAGRAARVGAQYPFAAILGCADSRVSPEFAFDQGPGDLFVVRVAGNFVDDDGLASLEYGVQFLGVRLIMVLGHSNCGAVAAAIKVATEGITLPGHLPELVESIAPAVQAAKASGASDLLAAATEQNVRLNVARLAAATPVLAAFVARGEVKVVGGVYDLATGKVAPV